jgi:hypothetical protein
VYLQTVVHYTVFFNWHISSGTAAMHTPDMSEIVYH